MIIEHVKYGQSIKIAGSLKDGKRVLDEFDLIIKQQKDCLFHCMGYHFNKKPYILYRRGKNRCNHCGVKINSKGMG